MTHKEVSMDIASSNDAYVAALIQKVQSFPALPAVVTRVMELAAEPDSTVDEFLQVIRLDLSLTAAILKLANSAFFGQTRMVSSLGQAIPILGLTEIRNMVIARAMFSSFKTVKGESWFDIRGFWIHSFLCGLAARVLSRESGTAEDVFISGLIHDIGKLVILSVFPAQFAQIASQASYPLFDMYQWEEKQFGVSHGTIGRHLLTRWTFPKKLTDSAGFHHQPELAEECTGPAALIYFADMVAHLGEHPPDFDSNPDYGSILFRPQNQERAELAGIPWNKDALKAYIMGMDQLKQEGMDLYALFFS